VAVAVTGLAGRSCEACRKGAPPTTEAEIAEYGAQIPEWDIVDRGGIPALERVFPFGNFVAAMEFANRIAELAEEQGHHPALLTEWGRVTVTWWTHKIRDLHVNDFVMAAKTDHAFNQREE